MHFYDIKSAENVGTTMPLNQIKKFSFAETKSFSKYISTQKKLDPPVQLGAKKQK